MPTPFEALCAVAKTKPKPGEAFDAFALRLTNKINNATDPEWNSLGDDSVAQKWHNATMTAFQQRRDAKVKAKQAEEDQDEAWNSIPIPELEGYEPVSTAPAASAEEEEKVDPETGEVTEAKVTPEKKVVKKKEKPAKKAKPEKKAKEAKAPKVKKVKEADAKLGRKGSFPLDAKITVIAKENPKRKGSEAEKLFKLYETGQTVSEALAAGLRWRDLRWDSEAKFIGIK